MSNGSKDLAAAAKELMQIWEDETNLKPKELEKIHLEYFAKGYNNVKNESLKFRKNFDGSMLKDVINFWMRQIVTDVSVAMQAEKPEDKAKSLAGAFGIFLSLVDNLLATEECSKLSLNAPATEKLFLWAKELDQNLHKLDIKFDDRFIHARLESILRQNKKHMSKSQFEVIVTLAAIFKH